MKWYADPLSLVVMYGFYKEYSTEDLTIETFDNVMGFQTFRVWCSQQGMKYNVTTCNYPGDKFIGKMTQTPKGRRVVQIDEGLIKSSSPGRPNEQQKELSKLTQKMLNNEMKYNLQTSRLCCDLTHLTLHASKMQQTTTKYNYALNTN